MEDTKPAKKKAKTDEEIIKEIDAQVEALLTQKKQVVARRDTKIANGKTSKNIYWERRFLKKRNAIPNSKRSSAASFIDFLPGITTGLFSTTTKTLSFYLPAKNKILRPSLWLRLNSKTNRLMSGRNMNRHREACKTGEIYMSRAAPRKREAGWKRRSRPRRAFSMAREQNARIIFVMETEAELFLVRSGLIARSAGAMRSGA
ncbi:MAG: hypothetical protein ACJ797_04445 [Ktedonobacteraceae bacterium]